MNKKLILSCVYGVFALTMVGCGNGQASTINALSKQLDRTTNTVSGITTTGLYNFSPLQSQQVYSKISAPSQDLSNYRGYVGAQIYKVQNSANEQEQLKDAILSQAATLKNSFKGLKLSKSQLRSLNDLTSNITKYTNCINQTKTDVNNTLRQIRRYNRPSSYNPSQVGTHLQNLNSHIDARLAYYRNLLSAMDQIQNIISTNDAEKTQENQNANSNIDTYGGYQGQNVSYKTPMKDYVVPHYAGENVNNYANNANGNNVNFVPGNGYGYGSNYGYGNGYGRGFNGRFNPNRNTDTYGPKARNIDTYRTMPNTNGGYGYNYYNGVAPVTTQAENDSEEPQQKKVITVKEDAKRNNDGQIEENVIYKGNKLVKTNKNNQNDVKTENENKQIATRKKIVPRKEQIVRTDKLLDVNKNIEKLIRG